MSQHLLTNGPLLDNDGNIIEAGYAFSLVKEYNRKSIKGLKSRIKEWDYYYFGNKEYGVAFTIADNSYMSLVSISIFDFKNKIDITSSKMGFFSFGKLNIPSSSKTGDLIYKKKGISIEFLNKDGDRKIKVHLDHFGKLKLPFDVNLDIKETYKDSMVIVNPFPKKKHFYYNQKINMLLANGIIKVNNQTIEFKDTYGVLDWGRGIWTYKNTWYWSSLSSSYEGKSIGWNLGYGFGDTKDGTENMLFYDGKAYKLNDVTFNIPRDELGNDDFMKPWNFSSLSNDINIIFTPIYNRHSDTNALIIRSNQNQVFGLFKGTFKINGETIYFEDLPGFAEKVYNRW